MTIIEHIREQFTGENSRNKNSAIVAGLLVNFWIILCFLKVFLRLKMIHFFCCLQFFTGWWILIDGLSVDPKHQITTGQAFIGVFGTVSFFMVNTVRNSHLTEENTSENGAMIAKGWLMIGFLMGFASIVAALWVMIADFINNRKFSNLYFLDFSLTLILS